MNNIAIGVILTLCGVVTLLRTAVNGLSLQIAAGHHTDPLGVSVTLAAVLLFVTGLITAARRTTFNARNAEQSISSSDLSAQIENE